MKSTDPMKELRFVFSNMLYVNIQESEAHRHPKYDADDFSRAAARLVVDILESEISHAEANGHWLDENCQGVGPGEHVPAVKIEYLRAALQPYRALLNGEVGK